MSPPLSNTKGPLRSYAVILSVTPLPLAIPQMHHPSWSKWEFSGTKMWHQIQLYLFSNIHEMNSCNLKYGTNHSVKQHSFKREAGWGITHLFLSAAGFEFWHELPLCCSPQVSRRKNKRTIGTIQKNQTVNVCVCARVCLRISTFVI